MKKTLVLFLLAVITPQQPVRRPVRMPSASYGLSWVPPKQTGRNLPQNPFVQPPASSLKRKKAAFRRPFCFGSPDGWIHGQQS